jgi:hypothetical protein
MLAGIEQRGEFLLGRGGVIHQVDERLHVGDDEVVTSGRRHVRS